MARRYGQLSAVKVAALMNTAGRHADGNGLMLQVPEFEDRRHTQAWVLRFQLANRRREMGLGALADVGLKEAREKAREAHRLIIDGIDPVEARRERKATLKAEAAKLLTFREASEKYIKAHTPGWKNGSKSAAQWTASLTVHAFPVLGNLDVRHIEVGHVMKVLEPIWTIKHETARRLRQRVENILDWCSTRGYRNGENCARWRGFLENLLPGKAKATAVRHMPSMPYAEVPAYIAELRANATISAKALEFTILTAARTSEAIGATWDEINFAERIWRVPGERIKSGKPHRVPLTDRCIALLKALPREVGSNFIFPGAKSKHPLSNMAMLELLRQSREGLSVHGFRSSFRTWASERTNYPPEVCEQALAHVVGNAVERSYKRTDLFEKRAKLMRDWASFCSTPVRTGTNVVSLKGNRR